MAKLLPLMQDISLRDPEEVLELKKVTTKVSRIVVIAF